MAKTDKTRPWRVKMSEHPREVHNHINGVCEIADGIADVGWGRETCYLDADWWRAEFRCGCMMCKGWSGNPNRVIRQAVKRDLRKYVPED